VPAPEPLIRALEPEDAQALEALCTQPIVARWLGGTPFDASSGFRDYLAGPEAERSLIVGMFEGGALRGYAGLTGRAPLRQRHVATLSMAVDPAHQRRGFGGRLLGRLLEAADRWHGWLRVELGVNAENAGAIALYRKHGFEAEGLQRAAVFTDGQRVDLLAMARLRAGFVAPPELGDRPPEPPRGPRATVTMRARREGDAEAFARLFETESALEGTLQLPHQTASSWSKRLASSSADACVIVAEHEGQMAGSAGLFPVGQSPRVRHVRTLGMVVHPDLQGRGVGHALMNALLEQADRWLDLGRVELEVYVDNARARALYERHGFVLEGTRRLHAFRRGTYVDAHAMARVRP
jgi:putative acetyltransferase